MAGKRAPSGNVRTRVIGWILISGLTVAFGARLVQFTPSPLWVLLVAVTPLVLFGAWATLAWAIISRRRWVGLISVLLIVAQLLWIRADFASGSPDVSRPDLRIATANMSVGNPAPDVAFESLAARGVDAILLQEVTPEMLDQMTAAPSWGEFGFRHLDARAGYNGSITVSRFPLREPAVIRLAGVPMTEQVIDTDAGSVRLINVHIIAPVSRENIEWWGQSFDDLVELIETPSATQGDPLPTVIAGDFNATGQHRGIRQLVSAGFADAHLDASSGWGATWPSDSNLPPILRLDHVFTDTSMSAIDLDVVEVVGTDHHGLVASLVLDNSQTD